jgi:hydrogenase maturation protease
MTPGLRELIQSSLRGRVCFMGLGNADGGDDAFGVRLAEALERAGAPDVVIGATAPEQLIGRCAEGGFDHLVFLDAADFGAAPGSVVFLNSQEMAARFPQISTHRLSVGMLAKCVEAGGTTRAWLLGAQPGTLKPSPALSPAIQKTLAILTDLIAGAVLPRTFDSLAGRSCCLAPIQGGAAAPPCHSGGGNFRQRYETSGLEEILT